MTTIRRMVSELQGNAMPDVLFGIEADYYDGCESYLSRWLPDQGFDFVLGSVHFVKELGYDRTGQMRMWNPEDVDETWQAYFRWVGQLALSGLFDAVAHIDLPKKFGRRASEKKIIEAAQLALDRVADAGMGLEINTSGLATKAAEIYPSPLILSMALERRIPVCFGSDSHHPQNVGRDFDKALRLARQVGYSHYFQIRKRMKKLVPLPITLAEL
jgi:histidinol-phosphatase (PHP family)